MIKITNILFRIVDKVVERKGDQGGGGRDDRGEGSGDGIGRVDGSVMLVDAPTTIN